MTEFETINIIIKYTINKTCSSILSLLISLNNVKDIEEIEELDIKNSIIFINSYINKLSKKQNIYIEENLNIDERELTPYVLKCINKKIVSILHKKDKPKKNIIKQTKITKCALVCICNTCINNINSQKQKDDIINEYYDDSGSEPEIIKTTDKIIIENKNPTIKNEFYIVEKNQIQSLNIIFDDIYNILNELNNELKFLIKIINEHNNSWFFWSSNKYISLTLNRIRENKKLFDNEKNILIKNYPL